MMAKQRTYTPYAREATVLMGQQIKLRRKRRQWSEQNLADRAGISRATLQKIEKGAMGCAVGLVFEVAALVGVNLFESDRLPLTERIERTQDKIALLPQRANLSRKAVRDDF